MRQSDGEGVNRTPPTDVRAQLRREVGFGCPVEDCGSPYLTWHHFDPPWSEREHHNPEGMIALCREHHGKADAGAFTKDQLRALKAESSRQGAQVRGRFNWMRQEVLAVVGGNFYLETPIIVQLRDQPVVWWKRDEDGFLRLNVHMLTASGQPRALIEDNDWITEGTEADIECPPSGKHLKISYPNGDLLRVEFRNIETVPDFEARYATQTSFDPTFPLTAVEVEMEVADTPFSFNARQTQLGGVTMANCWSKNCQVGIQLG
jgi:hypothetical protein